MSGLTRRQRRTIRRASLIKRAAPLPAVPNVIFYRPSPPGEYSSISGFVVHLRDGRALRVGTPSQYMYSLMESMLPQSDAYVAVGPKLEQFHGDEHWCAVSSRQTGEGLSSLPCKVIPKKGWITS